MRTRVVVVDIEGTTSSIAFVKDVLFPFARRRLEAFVAKRRDDPDVRRELEAAAEAAGVDPGDTAKIVEALARWIDEDRKVTALKALQGMIWRHGYESGELVAHVYDDAADALARWRRAGLELYVYSSGSVLAQRLFFAHTTRGDLTGLFSGYFDTTTGGKLQSESYRRIVEAVGVAPGDVVFLSDVQGELDAAREAGMGTVWVRRPEEGAGKAGASERPSARHVTASDFGEIELW